MLSAQACLISAPESGEQANDGRCGGLVDGVERQRLLHHFQSPLGSAGLLVDASKLEERPYGGEGEGISVVEVDPKIWCPVGEMPPADLGGSVQSGGLGLGVGSLPRLGESTLELPEGDGAPRRRPPLRRRPNRFAALRAPTALRRPLRSPA
ncbi:hypothetical protein Mro03_14810 [Microbispora rosea subsp. rosea]|nr:hypothetical protein Mro03_14810 [Microbispora rosea subsp. rosea]